jgi:glycine/D-amino acid oxidase-like deaminating enzyme
MTGVTVALEFARAGARVAVMESDLVGRGSTAASTALLLREPDLGLGDLGRLYGARKARRIWELCEQSARTFVRTIRRLEIDCELTIRDSIYYTTNAETVRSLRREYQRRRDGGFAGKWLTPGSLRRLTGIPGRGAIRTRNAQFDPYKTCLGLAKAAADAGAAIFEQSPARGIEHSGDAVRIATGRGVLHASHVVVATGYARPSFQPLAGRFRINHAYVLATRPLSVSQQREIGIGDVMIWDTQRPYRPAVPGQARTAAFRKATTELREHFEALLPALADVAIDRSWEGLFAMTPDGLPYIGPHGRYPRHLFALGYGGNGMAFGFHAARTLLEQWQGVKRHTRNTKR